MSLMIDEYVQHAVLIDDLVDSDCAHHGVSTFMEVFARRAGLDATSGALPVLEVF